MPQRSPIIFWLLLAATLCVDAVVLSWVAPELRPDPGYATVCFDALIVSQLNVVCIRSAFSSTKTSWTRIAPLLAAALAAILAAKFINDPVRFDEAIASELSHYGLHAALLLMTLWLFQRTTFWRRRSGLSLEWKYSLAHVLFAMTAVAVLATAMRNSSFFGNNRLLNLTFVCSSVLLAVATVLIWSQATHWLIRSAGVFAFAILLGAAVWLTTDWHPSFKEIIGAHYMIQALVISVWLGCGVIIPTRRETSTGET